MDQLHHLLDASIMHRRQGKIENAFVYRSRYMLLDVATIDSLNALTGVAFNRSNWVSIQARNHLPGLFSGSLMDWAHHVASQHGFVDQVKSIKLLTMPRVCGYLFNPVSFWFCLNEQEQLIAVIAEVNNTFHERYCYVCYHDDHRAIQSDDVLTAEKVFYVSPFIEIKGHYQFRFHLGDEIKVWIEQFQPDGKCLTATISGRKLAMSGRSVCWFFVNKPWRTLMVMWLIHYQAVKLWLKKAKLIQKPKKPPQQEI